MMDEHEKLHLLSKGDLKEVNHPQHSLMPAAKLSAAELDNLIAFFKKTAPSEIGPGPWTPTADLNVSFQRIRNAREEPQNWLTYFGDYQGTHYSRLKSITPANVASLKSQWSFQFAGTNVEVTPLVVDGIMFVTGPMNNAAALDARTGRSIWRYTRRLPDVHSQCTVMTNRGFAILGDAQNLQNSAYGAAGLAGRFDVTFMRSVTIPPDPGAGQSSTVGQPAPAGFNSASAGTQDPTLQRLESAAYQNTGAGGCKYLAVRYDTVESTNDEAKRLARAGAEPFERRPATVVPRHGTPAVLVGRH